MPEMQQKDDRIELNPPSFTQYHYLFAHIQQKGAVAQQRQKKTVSKTL